VEDDSAVEDNKGVPMPLHPYLALIVSLIGLFALVMPARSQEAPPVEAPPAALMNAGFDESEASTVQLFRGKGCEKCSNTGYKGRTALYEVMVLEDEIRELVLSGGSAYEVRQKALQQGMMSLRQSGLHKIRNGVTTIEEVVRETVG